MIEMDSRFFAWYAEVDGAADLPIQALMDAFEAGTTPEEMNKR